MARKRCPSSRTERAALRPRLPPLSACLFDPAMCRGHTHPDQSRPCLQDVAPPSQRCACRVPCVRSLPLRGPAEQVGVLQQASPAYLGQQRLRLRPPRTVRPQRVELAQADARRGSAYRLVMESSGRRMCLGGGALAPLKTRVMPRRRRPQTRNRVLTWPPSCSYSWRATFPAADHVSRWARHLISFVSHNVTIATLLRRDRCNVGPHRFRVLASTLGVARAGPTRPFELKTSSRMRRASWSACGVSLSRGSAARRPLSARRRTASTATCAPCLAARRMRQCPMHPQQTARTA